MTEAALALALSMAAAGGADCRWPQPLVVDPAATRVAISSGASFGRFDDSSRSLVLARVLEAPICNAFISPVSSRNDQATRATVWLRFALDFGSAGGEGWLLSVPFPNFERICVHWPGGEGSYQTRCGGLDQPVSERPLPHNQWLFKVPRDVDAARPVLVQLDSKAPMSLEMRLVRSEAFIEDDHQTQFLSGAFNGALLATSLYVFLLFTRLKDRPSLFYAIHLAAIAFALLGFDGRGFEYLWGGLGSWSAHLPTLFLGISLLSGAFYGRAFLATAQTAPRLDRALSFAALSAASTFPLNLWNLAAAESACAVASVVFAFSLSLAGWSAARRGDHPARYLLLGFLAPMPGMAVVALGVLGLPTLPGGGGMTLTKVGVVVGALISSLGLIQRLRERDLLRLDALRRASEERETALDRAERIEVALEAALREMEGRTAQLEAAFSERERLLLDLSAKNAELEKFTYTVSHDLKSPLVTIRSFVGYLLKDSARGRLDRLQHDASRILAATQRMGQVLDDLLELSRVGRVTNPPTDISLQELAHEAVEQVRGRLDARGVRVSIMERLPEIRGDRARLLAVFQNLIDNAAKFMGEQKEPLVEIGVREASADRVVVFVRDNGAGIDPRYHAKIFALFERLDPGTEGTGLGLALVSRIIDAHGGRVWVESRGESLGSTFFVDLPRMGGSSAV